MVCAFSIHQIWNVTTEDKPQTVMSLLLKTAPLHNKEISLADVLILFSAMNYIKRLPQDKESFGSYFVSINPGDYFVSLRNLKQIRTILSRSPT